MKKHSLRIGLFFCLAIFLSTADIYAQDTLKISMISFEYDESGSMVEKIIEMEEDENEEMEEDSSRKEQSSTYTSSKRDGHLTVKGHQETFCVEVFIPNYTDYAERILKVHNLAGMQIFSAYIDEAQSTFNLSQLQTGTYLITLTLDGVDETKKVIKRK